MHFDTFGYIKVNYNSVETLFETASKKIKLPNIGEKFSF